MDGCNSEKSEDDHMTVNRVTCDPSCFSQIPSFSSFLPFKLYSKDPARA